MLATFLLVLVKMLLQIFQLAHKVQFFTHQVLRYHGNQNQLARKVHRELPETLAF